MERRKIAIVGAGVGGLAAAARLAKQGYPVEVYEKLPKCGGRANLLEDKGFKFDMGPSFVLMPDFFEEVFSYCGESLKDYLDLRALDVHYKIFYPDSSYLSVYHDSERTKEDLEKIEAGSGAAYEKFLKETGKIYNLVRPLLYKCFSRKSLLSPRYWPLILKIRPVESYWHLARRFFKSEKLCSAFTFQAMFMGVSPYQAPAFYSMISYADHVQKVWHPMGGMYKIPLALEKMAKKFGAQFNYNAGVKRITRDSRKIILELDRRDVVADRVVVNADYAYAQDELLGRKIPKYKYSCSTYLLYLGLKKKVKGLEHHNLFFSQDLQKNLRQLFKEKTVPDDPSFYVHVPTVTDPTLAPPDKDILYILVPVPNLEDIRADVGREEERLRRAVFERINKVLLLNLEDLIEVEHKFYPLDFIRRYNVKYGASFGLAHNLTQSAFFRPRNFDARIRNLYYVGASTQPGGGLPVVIAGSRIIADRIH